MNELNEQWANLSERSKQIDEANSDDGGKKISPSKKNKTNKKGSLEV